MPRFRVQRGSLGLWHIMDGDELEGAIFDDPEEAEEHCAFLNSSAPDHWTLRDYRIAKKQGWIE